MATPILSKDIRIRIRMYHVGFGDCFLVRLPGEKKTWSILIDCGVHVRGDLKIMGKVVDNIASETGGVLDLIVATHAHQDHISGFGSEAAKFRQMKVAEVWLPWTEDPDDTVAAGLKKKQLALVDQLQHHFQALGAAGAAHEAAQHALANMAGNAPALDLLKKQLKAKVSYLAAADEAIENAAGIPGLRVKVLGPPKDQKFLARMDPPSDQSYLRMNAGSMMRVNGIAPFHNRWEFDYQHPPLSAADLDYFEDLANEAARNTAFTLDQGINNTSLVLLLQFGGRSLLFPGDAQYGNWQSWIGKHEAEETLESVHFLKVAHHGSENATPKGALERMPDGQFAAMISTQSTPWPSIPYGNLMDALNRKTHKQVVRSDQALDAAAPLPGGFTKGDFWVDYTLQLGKTLAATPK